jgi:chromosome segregation ATPase
MDYSGYVPSDHYGDPRYQYSSGYRSYPGYGVPGAQSPMPSAFSQTTSLSEQTLVFRLEIMLPEDVKPVAQEFMRAVVGNFEGTLYRAFDDLRRRLSAQLEIAADEANTAEGKLQVMQKQLREISRSRRLSRQELLNDIDQARGQIENFQMDQAPDMARVDFVSIQIAKTEAQLKEQLATDSVSRELTQIVEINAKQLSQMETLVQQGKASSSELEQAREKLTRARIELAQRQEQLSKPLLAKIESLNRDLANYSLNKTQTEARIAQYERRVQEAAEMLAVADQYEILSLKADVIKQNLQETIRWRDQMERRNRMVLPPSVSVIGADMQEPLNRK